MVRLGAVIELIERLLDLENIHLGHDAPLLVKWGVHVPPWVLFCAAVAGITWITLVYRLERASPRRKIALGGLRAAIVALVVVMLCRPSLVLVRNRVEPSHVTLLIDTSQSMAMQEPYHDEQLAQAVARGAGLEGPSAMADHPRLDLVKAALLRHEAASLLRLLERNGVQLSTFAGTAETRGFAASSEALPQIVERIEALRCDGRSTDLAGALTEAVDDAHGRRLAAIILATDGQATEPTSLDDALDQAQGRQIPILPLRFGSTIRPLDIDVGPVRAEESVFANDIVSIEAQITASGLAEATSVTVQLTDDQSGTIAVSEELSLDPAQHEPGASARTEPGTRHVARTVELRFKPNKTGRFRYRLEVPPLPHERTTANNVAYVDMTILDDRLRVLYVEGYPRYEYRYLKNALLREETLELSVLLLEADGRFVQEGAQPIRRFPDTVEELSRYDVVLFGDVDPHGGWLSDVQMKMLLDFVGHEGGGFGLIAGERFAPHRFVGTPLEKLIPVRIDPEFPGHEATPLTTGFCPRLTPEGERSRLFRFAVGDVSAKDGSAIGSAGTPGLDGLPELYWLARTLGARPGASVLAYHPTIRTLSGPMPVVVVGRYGAGRIFFQATDDTWQWRRHTGELPHDTYWVQVARELMRQGRVSQDRRFVIRTGRRVYAYGSPIETQVEVFDPQLLTLHGDTIGIVVTEQASRGPQPAPGAEPPGGDTATDLAPFVTARFDVHRISPDSGLFEGTYVPPHAGTFALRAEEIAPRPGEGAALVYVRVEQPDLEARRPEANHEVLQRIAESTGGRVIELDQLEEEFGAIRDRSIQIPDDITEPLWDSRLALMVFVLMISMEWVLRKAFGLL